jgi:hypothetical protein
MDQDKTPKATDEVTPEKAAEASELDSHDLDEVSGGAMGGAGGGSRPPKGGIG